MQSGGKDKRREVYRPDGGCTVTIVLSERMLKKVLSCGCVGTRIIWVRITSSICDLFVIVIYIPHKGRTNPSVQDTIEKIKELLNTIERFDCVILMDDFNCQLRRNVQGDGT